MNGTNLFKIAFRALANNKLRAFLTMLGIIIGVASVITMLAIGQGSKKSIQAQISEMGSNMIMIHPGADMRGGVRQDPSAMQTLKLTDYEALRNETNFLAAVSPNVSSSGQLIAGNNNYPSSVSGVGTDYLEIRQLTVQKFTTDAPQCDYGNLSSLGLLIQLLSCDVHLRRAGRRKEHGQHGCLLVFLFRLFQVCFLGCFTV